MINSKLLALLGVALIVVGIFLPLATEEAYGEENTLGFWDFNEDNDLAADGVGVYLLAIALVGGLIVLVDRAEYVWVPVLLLVWYIIYQLPTIWALNRNDLGYTPGAGWMLLAAGTWLLSAPLLWPNATDSAEEESEHEPAHADATPQDVVETTKSPAFDLQLVLRWVGLVLLVGGFFVPLAKVNEQSMFYTPNTVNGSTFMQIALVLAGAALALRREGALWVVGLITLLVLGNDLRVVNYQVDHATTSGELRWGWLLLFDGAAVLLLTFFLGEDRSHVATVIREFFATDIAFGDEDDEDEVNDTASEDTSDDA